MRPQSAKAKGRRLQQHVAKRIQETFNLPASDVKSLPMGSQGCDVWLSAAAKQQFPFAIECKNVEKLNVGEAMKQTIRNAEESATEEGHWPLLVHSKNHSDVLVTMRFEDFLALHEEMK